MDTLATARRDAGPGGRDDAPRPVSGVGIVASRLAFDVPPAATPEPRFDPAVVGPQLAAAIAAPQIMSAPPIFLDED